MRNGFEAKSVYVWTSAYSGTANASGPVTFTGTRSAGTTISQTVTITPTGFTGNDYIKFDFPPTWSNVPSPRCRSRLGGTLNYVALDRFEYRALPLDPVCAEPVLELRYVHQADGVDLQLRLSGRIHRCDLPDQHQRVCVEPLPARRNVRRRI